MNITKELREYANGWRDRSCGMHLLDIADRIDEQHSKALEKVAAKVAAMVDESDELDKLKCHLDSLDKIAAEYRFNIVALAHRICAIERKLSGDN